jgi:hypothetical protein
VFRRRSSVEREKLIVTDGGWIAGGKEVDQEADGGLRAVRDGMMGNWPKRRVVMEAAVGRSDKEERRVCEGASRRTEKTVVERDQSIKRGVKSIRPVASLFAVRQRAMPLLAVRDALPTGASTNAADKLNRHSSNIQAEAKAEAASACLVVPAWWYLSGRASLPRSRLRSAPGRFPLVLAAPGQMSREEQPRFHRPSSRSRRARRTAIPYTMHIIHLFQLECRSHGHCARLFSVPE